MTSAKPGAFVGQHAVVVGFGASGRAAARVLRAEGADVIVSERRTREELSLDPIEEAEAAELAVEVRAGGHRPEHLGGASVVIQNASVSNPVGSMMRIGPARFAFASKSSRVQGRGLSW